MTYKARLNAKINGAARVRFYSPELQQLDAIESIRAKAAAFIQNHPRPRAIFH